MSTVYEVSAPGWPITRMHLPASEWGRTVQHRLTYMGYQVTPTDQPAWPDNRDAAELARRDELLEWASPD